MKKIFPLFLLATLTVAASCSKSDKNNVKPTGLPKAEASTTDGGIAFVDLDTLKSQYLYYKDCEKELEAKSNTYEADINKRGAALQRAGAEFQRKIQEGVYTSQEQAAAAQASLMKQQGELEKLQASYAQKFAKDQENYSKALRDSLDNFLRQYNKDKKYSMILTKDVILLGDDAMEITKEVVAGMNKRYSKKK